MLIDNIYATKTKNKLLVTFGGLARNYRKRKQVADFCAAGGLTLPTKLV